MARRTVISIRIGCIAWLAACTSVGSAQTPVSCQEPQLRTILQNVIRHADQVPAASRRAVFESVRSECGPGFDKVAAKVFSGYGYSQPDRLLDQAGNRLRALRSLRSSSDLFHDSAELPPGLETISRNPLIELRGRVGQLTVSPVHRALDQLATSVLTKAAPALLSNTADLQQFAALTGEPSVEAAAPFLTVQGRSAIAGLSAREQAEVIGALQSAVVTRVELVPQGMTADAAVGQVRGLVRTVKQFDERMESVSQTLRATMGNLNDGMRVLTALADPIAPRDASGTPASSRASLIAGTLLGTLQSHSLSELGRADGPLQAYVSALGSDSEVGSIVSSAQNVVMQALSVSQAGAAALSDVSSLLDFGRSNELTEDVLGSVAGAVSNLGGVGDLVNLFSAASPLGAVSSVFGMVGFGGPSEIEKLQAHLDQRLDEIDGRLGEMDRKLDRMLTIQQEILKGLDGLNKKIDDLQDQLRMTRSDILSELEKVRYEVLYNRSISLDAFQVQMNGCNAFLNTMEDESHRTYTQKAAYFESPGVADLFKGCLTTLQQFVEYPDPDSVPTLFKLEAYKDEPGFEGVDKYLAAIKPTLMYYAGKLTRCEANALAYPSYPSGAGLLECENKELDRPGTRVPRPDPTDARVIKANDPAVKSRLTTVLNYKAVLRFADIVVRISPFLALTDRSRQNSYLVPGERLGEEFSLIDTSTARKLIGKALSFLNAAIAQQSAIEGNGLAWMEAPYPSGRNSYRADSRSLPLSVSVRQELRTNPLFLANLLREVISDWALPVDDGGAGGSTAKLKGFLRNQTVAAEAEVTVPIPPDAAMLVLDVPRLLIQDASVPRKWYLILGGPTVDYNFVRVAMLNHKMLVVSGGLPNAACGQNPLAEANRQYATYEIRSGQVIPLRHCGMYAPPNVTSNSEPQPSFANVILIPVPDNFDVPEPTAEMVSLLSMRNSLLWVGSEYDATTGLTTADRGLLAALDLLPPIAAAAR